MLCTVRKSPELSTCRDPISLSHLHQKPELHIRSSGSTSMNSGTRAAKVTMVFSISYTALITGGQEWGCSYPVNHLQPQTGPNSITSEHFIYNLEREEASPQGIEQTIPICTGKKTESNTKNPQTYSLPYGKAPKFR